MTKINIITEHSDISQRREMNWDVWINSEPYTVASFDEYVHSIGGHYGDNNLWAYPRGEEPTSSNVIEFSDICPVKWGYRYEPSNKMLFKYNEKRLESDDKITITRNDKDFCEVQGEMSYSLPKVLTMIGEFIEHPLNLNSIDYDKRMIGTKVWWRGQPGIVSKYINGSALVVIEPDNCNFEIPKEFQNDQNMSEYYAERSIVTSMLDKHIWWFR